MSEPHEPNASETTGEIHAPPMTEPAQPDLLAEAPDPVPVPAEAPDPVPVPSGASSSHSPAPPAGNYPPLAATPPYPGPYGAGPYGAGPYGAGPYGAGPYGAGPSGAGPYPNPNPFAPATREPWLNPAKRGMAALLAVLVAVVLLGVGFVAGAALANHRDRGLSQVERGGARYGPLDHPGAGRFRGPGGVAPTATPVPAVSPTAVSPAPSSSHS